MQELYPRKIQPGWAKRWTLQTVELARRAPLLLLLVSLCGTIGNSLLPGQNTWIGIPLSVLCNVWAAGWLFLALRAADTAGKQPWSEFFRQIQNTRRDLLGLIVWVGLYCTTIGAIFNLLLHGLSSLRASPSPAMPSGTSKAIEVAGLLAVCFFWPGVSQMLYLTLKMGNSPGRWFRFGYHSCLQNPDILLRWQLPGFGLLTLCGLMVPSHISREAGLGVAALAGVVWYWAGSWAYLYCREMYDGREENSKVLELVQEAALPVVPQPLPRCR